LKPESQPKKRGALSYLRVSTQEQAELGLSLDAQRDRITAYCEARGFELLDTIVDAGVSGKSIKNRPGLQEALAKLKRGQVLVVYALSRLARSTIDLLNIERELKRRGVELASVTEPHMDTTTGPGNMHFQVMAAFNEFERNCISDRTKMAMAHLRRQHRFCGGAPPLGWRVEGRYLAPDPKEQAVLQLVRTLHAKGCSLRTILKMMEFRRVFNRQGKPFALAQVQRILRHPTADAIKADTQVPVAVEPSTPGGEERVLRLHRSRFYYEFCGDSEFPPPRQPRVFLDLETGEAFRVYDTEIEAEHPQISGQENRENRRRVLQEPGRHLLLPHFTDEDMNKALGQFFEQQPEETPEEAAARGPKPRNPFDAWKRDFPPFGNRLIYEKAEAFLRQRGITFCWYGASPALE
jgi:DNA invertase Pin-like site-specific DNA recombinase